MSKILKALLIILVSVTTSFAQDTTSTPLKISGAVDGYYRYSFNGHKDDVGLTAFTQTHNSFELGMAQVTLSKTFGKASFVADLAVGPRAEIANGYTGTTLSAIKQLYVSYAFSDKFSVTAGNFGTHVGYELIDAPLNVNYSTSYLFTNGPFYHTGVKLNYTSGVFGAMFGIANETDRKTDLNNNKHFLGQLSVIPSDEFSAYLNYVGGNSGDESVDGTGETGHQFDLVASYLLSDALKLGLNFSNKMISYKAEGVDDASWMGLAAYINYTASENALIGFRGEYFDDPDGLNVFNGIPDGGNVMEFTLSGNIKHGPLTFIPELRFDTASEDIFIDKDGAPTSSSPSILAAIVYSF